MTKNLDFCLALHHAHASLQRKLDDELGIYHGIGFGDFALLETLARADDGRACSADLAPALGLSASGLVRQLIALEKVGLVIREGDDDGRTVTLRAPGRALVREARDTAARICDAAIPAIGPDALAPAWTAMNALAQAPALTMPGRG
jgi:DNA-binding MarR family transcriptional regulator